MLTFTNRISSVVVSLILIYLSTDKNDINYTPAETLIFIIPTLILIWFGDYVAETTYLSKTEEINATSPGWLVSFCGWIILLGIPVVSVILKE